MPKWNDAPDSLVKVFQEAVATVPEATLRKIFGYPALFYRGQMFAGLHNENMILRLTAIDRGSFLEQNGARIFEPMPGRPMREYVVVPPRILNSPTESTAGSTRHSSMQKVSRQK